eukprot:TRINITY_DN1743_c0_g3_i2.p7 TRINITY_DN1743_c0_g3~~TRINITY_DN1743_c0_g3_i2.p7  ORF type:complete len:126 (+),score=16.83 TRINITY_DN1743_c0_g3_i2:26-379(+)
MFGVCTSLGLGVIMGFDTPLKYIIGVDYQYSHQSLHPRWFPAKTELILAICELLNEKGVKYSMPQFHKDSLMYDQGAVNKGGNSSRQPNADVQQYRTAEGMVAAIATVPGIGNLVRG